MKQMTETVKGIGELTPKNKKFFITLGVVISLASGAFGTAFSLGMREVVQSQTAIKVSQLSDDMQTVKTHAAAVDVQITGMNNWQRDQDTRMRKVEANTTATKQQVNDIWNLLLKNKNP